MIGEIIKKLRHEKGISARELARRSEISQAYLSQLETGKNNNPTTNILKAISKGLNIDYLELIEKAGYNIYIDDLDVYYENNPFLHKVTNSDGVWTHKELSIVQIKKLTDLYENLNMGIDVTYKGERLSNEEKKKILIMLETMLETISEEE